MINSKALEKSISDASEELRFDSSEPTGIENAKLHVTGNGTAPSEKLQKDLGFSGEEMESLINVEHFNHQY